MDTFPHISDFVKVNGVRLHYLDWSGNGPVLLFLAALGCSAYIYTNFAPRFIDNFHVIALTRRGHGDSDYPETGYDPDSLTEDVRQFLNALETPQVILVGHSMSNVELCHFAALYPERVLKLVFLDAAYDRTLPGYKAIMEKNPLKNIQPPGSNEDYYTVEDYIAVRKRGSPSLAAIWDTLLDEEVLHSITISPEGKVVEKMSPTIGKALNDTLTSYMPEDSLIRAPVLSIYTILDSAYFLAPDYMTEEQQSQVIEFIDTLRPPHQRECIEQFRRHVPHARIVEIPKGHHYCFIKHEELVYDEMHRFLME
jgi:non-heme chloroperoxidase